jgi:uncharacterized membrane protein
MRISIAFIMVSLVLLLLSLRAVWGQNHVEYMIRINKQGSAAWTIRLTGTNISASLETLVEFRNRVVALVEAAKSKTERDMVAPNETMSVMSTFSGSYVAVEYSFQWINFSKTEDTRIIVGDVFQVQGFFVQLYGDGEVRMIYPSEYIAKAVSPSPSERNDSLQTLGWPGTEDFNAGGANIVLEGNSHALGFLGVLWENVVPVVSLTILVTGSSLGFYFFRQRGRKQLGVAKAPEIHGLPQLETDEEKTVKLLQASGGSLYQSAITDYCKFSRAKTSQLLSILENEGTVRRIKKGRDKIVVLIEQDKK